MKKKSKVEIKSDVAVNLSRKRLPSAGSPCKRKSWFDHNVIIRSYVYATSVVHATEIHLRSLIGARTRNDITTLASYARHVNGNFNWGPISRNDIVSRHAHVCAYTRIALNLMRSLNEVYPSAEKIYMRIALQKSSTCADRLLDNHVVISEHRKFCYWKSLRSLVRKWVSER